MGAMFDELVSFYARSGILSTSFSCQHIESCRGSCASFTEAKSAYVGPDYEKGTLPRLLFLSLDSGSADRDPERRTPEAVRLQETTCDVGNLPKGRHWYRTHELAPVLLWQFDETLTPENVSPHFAHANSAKCCMNKAHRSLADDRLFHNCREYLPGELKILKPKILVTQGAWAKTAIEQSFDVRQVSAAGEPDCRCAVLDIRQGSPSLWIHTHHPTAFRLFNHQRRNYWKQYAAWVGEFRSRQELSGLDGGVSQKRTPPSVSPPRASLDPAEGAPPPKRQRTSLSGKRLRIVDQVFRSGNPRVPHTHGWLAFEVLRRAEGGTLLFEEYERRLFHPAREIREEASRILGVKDAYQHLKHIKHDIAKGRVVAEDAS